MTTIFVFQKHVKISAFKLHQFPSTLHQKNTSKQFIKGRRFCTRRNYIEGNKSKRRQFFSHRNYIEKVRRNDVEIHRYFLFHISA